jgi:hypothetical protein
MQNPAQKGVFLLEKAGLAGKMTFHLKGLKWLVCVVNKSSGNRSR